MFGVETELAAVLAVALNRKEANVSDVLSGGRCIVEYWTFNDEFDVFRFIESNDILIGGVYSRVDGKPIIEIREGEFLPLLDEDEDIAIDIQKAIEFSEW
eukprot:g2619.t1